MYRIIFCLLSIVLCLNSNAQSFHSKSVSLPSGGKMELGVLKGKKTLIVILPISVNDSIWKAEVLPFYEKYNTSVQLLFISIQDSANISDRKEDVLSKAQSLFPGNLVIGNVNNRSADNNAGILSYFLNDKENGHFSNSTIIPGSKYLISEEGELYAVIGPEVNVDHPIFDRAISRTFIRKN